MTHFEHEKRLLNLVADLDHLVADDPLIPATIQFLYDLRHRLPTFVVYDHPTDHPDRYVARLWGSLPEATALHFMVVTEDLAVMRAFLDALGLVHLHRQPGDDPVILETWI